MMSLRMVLLVAAGLGSVAAYGDSVVETFDRELSPRWSVIESGAGRVLVEDQALHLVMPEGTGKRAVAAMAEPLQPTADRPVRLFFNMRLDTVPGGYNKGVQYGRPGFAVRFGRYGRRNFDKQASHIYLADQSVAVDARPDVWLHFDVTLGLESQTLAVYAVDERGKPEGDPLARLKSRQRLGAYENNLIVMNENPFHDDTYAQARGSVWFDSLRMSGEQAATAEVMNFHTLKGVDTAFEIDLDTGRLAGGTFQGQAVLETSADEYRLALREQDVLALESEDRVIEIGPTTPTSIELVAENPDLPGLSLRKAYRVEDGQLVKTLTLDSEQTVDGFLTVRIGANPSLRLRDGGFYHTIKGWEVDTLRDTATVAMETKIGHPNADTGNQVVALVNPGLRVCLGQFQYRVDGEYVWPRHYVHSDSTTYAPHGWRYPAIVFRPEEDRPRSVETRLVVIEGDQVDFHEVYRAMGEVATRLEVESPEWVRRAKFDAVCWGQDPVAFSLLAQGALDQSRYTEEEYAFVNMWGWATWGHQPTEPEEQVRIRGESELIAYKPTQWLVDSIAHIHDKLPGCKFGLYHFPWALAPQSPYGADNPDQMAYARDGKLLPKPEPGWTAAYRALLADEGVDGMLEDFRREIERYGVDFFYLDGGVASQARPDWRTMTAEQGHDWMRLWQGVFDIARSAGSDKAVYQNHFVQMYGDAGFYEDGAFARTYDHNWRIIGDGLQLAKLYQRPGGYLSVLYRGGGGHAEPGYTNMVLAMGLRPAAAADPHVVPNWPNWFAYMSYVNAAFELRDTVWVDAVVEPRWWADIEQAGSLQAVTLRQGEALLVNLVNHDTKVRSDRVVVDLDAADFPTDRPLYLWRQDLTPATYEDAQPVRAPAEPVVLDRVIEARPLGVLMLDERKVFERNEQLQGQSMASLVLTPEPVVITWIGARETQFNLPNILDASVSASVFDDRVEVEVDSPSRVGVAVWLPDWFGDRAVVDGQGRVIEVVEVHGIRLARLTLEAGLHAVTLLPEIPE